LATDGLTDSLHSLHTDKQVHALSRSRYRDWRLNKQCTL